MTHNAHLGATEKQWTATEIKARRKAERPMLSLDTAFTPELMAEVGRKVMRSVVSQCAAANIRLTGGNVLIRLLEPERHCHSLIIPETAKREPYELWRGEVIAVGPGSRAERRPNNELMNPTKVWGETLRPCDVKPGEKVMFYFLGGKTGTQWPDKNYRIINESMIQCVLE
jgi:co-chaperonin GroES (HSP10)